MEEQVVLREEPGNEKFYLNFSRIQDVFEKNPKTITEIIGFNYILFFFCDFPSLFRRLVDPWSREFLVVPPLKKPKSKTKYIGPDLWTLGVGSLESSSLLCTGPILGRKSVSWTFSGRIVLSFRMCHSQDEVRLWSLFNVGTKVGVDISGLPLDLKVRMDRYSSVRSGEEEDSPTTVSPGSHLDHYYWRRTLGIGDPTSDRGQHRTILDRMCRLPLSTHSVTMPDSRRRAIWSPP